MKKYYFFALACVIMCTSCKDSISDNKKENVTIYAYKTDTTVVVFRHGTTVPITLKKPISLDEIQKYGFSAKTIETIQKDSKGISRYIDEDENNVYQVSEGTAFFIFVMMVILAVCICIITGVLNE